MKLQLFVIFLLAFMVSAQTWQFATVDITYFGTASLALDSAGNPHICYDTGLPANELMYARFINGNWEVEIVDYAGDVISCTTSLALDSSGNPHISYCDYSNYDLKYAFWDGSYWEVEIVDCAGDVSGTTSLALDSSGNPHISFRSTFYPSHLEYAFWNGSYWEVETVDPTIYSGSRSSLALDSSSNPHICYFSYYLGTAQGSLKYAWKTETSIEGGSILPPATLLHSPVPNPFASSTTVTFELAEPGNVRLSVFDLSGRLMETLLDGAMISGVHSAVLEGTGIASGVYLIRLVSGSQATTTRVVLMR